MNLRCAITTHNRPVRLARLLDDLRAQRGSITLDLHLYNDASDDLITDGRKLQGVEVYHFAKRHGKKLFWKIWNKILADFLRSDNEVLLAVQDDMRLDDDFLIGVRNLLTCMEEQEWYTINLYPDDMNPARWTGRPVGAEGPCDLVKSQWIDLACFLMHRRTLALIPQLVPVKPNRWDDDPDLSTGVGRQLSKRLVWGAERTLYQTAERWAEHDDEAESKLHGPAESV